MNRYYSRVGRFKISNGETKTFIVKPSAYDHLLGKGKKYSHKTIKNKEYVVKHMDQYFENIDTNYIKVLVNYETDSHTYPYALYDSKTQGILCFDKGKSNNNYYAFSTRIDKKLKKHTTCYNIIDVKTNKCLNKIKKIENARGPPYYFI